MNDIEKHTSSGALKTKRSFDRQLTVGLGLVDELGNKTVGMTVARVQQVQHDVDVVPLNTRTDEQFTSSLVPQALAPSHQRL